MSKKIVVIVVLAAVGLAMVLFIAGTVQEKKFVEAVSFDRMEAYVSEDGSARVEYIMWQPPSYISSFNKLMVQNMGEDIIANLYDESIRKYYAMMGFEIENFSCEVTGMGDNDNFTLTLTWVVPLFARWDGESWRIDLNWVDRRLGAEDSISEGDSEWVFLRSIARSSGYDFGTHTAYSTSFTFLPDGAADIQLTGTSSYLDYGGGSYSESHVELQEINGVPVVVENDLSFTSTEEEMTITVDDLLAGYSPFSVSYTAPEPASWSFADSLEWLRLDLKYGRTLRENYPVRLNGSWYYMTPAQALRYSAKFLIEISEGEEFSVGLPFVDVTWPENEEGSWEAAWKELTKEEYLSLADQASACESVSSWFDTSVGKVRPSDLLYMFLRTLSAYRKSGALPDRVQVVPIPKGELVWGSYRIGADNAYYLLSDSYVIVNGNMAQEVLDNIADELDNRGLAEEICNWTGSNISYGLYFRPPTSEDVLSTRHGQCRDFTNVYLALARSAGIPARRISGWVVSEWQPPAGWEFVVTSTPDGKNVCSHAWVEALIPGEGWISIEPQSSRPSLFVETLPYEIYKRTEQTWIEALTGYETAGGPL